MFTLADLTVAQALIVPLVVMALGLAPGILLWAINGADEEDDDQ